MAAGRMQLLINDMLEFSKISMKIEHVQRSAT